MEYFDGIQRRARFLGPGDAGWAEVNEEHVGRGFA